MQIACWKCRRSGRVTGVAATFPFFFLYIFKNRRVLESWARWRGEVKKKHPNHARSCPRQTHEREHVAQMPLGTGLGWVCAPRGSLQRGAPISASPSFRPPVVVLAGGAAPCHVPMPGASWAGGSGRGEPPSAGVDVQPRAPTAACSPLPTQGPLHPGHRPAGSAACPELPAPPAFVSLPARGPLAVININTESAAPSPPL